MKNLEKKLNKIMSEVDERTKYYDVFKDQIMLGSTQDTILKETYFNELNRLFTNSNYTEDNNEEIILNRRIILDNIFFERVKFLMDEKLNFVKNYLQHEGIFCNVTSEDVMKADYRLFELQTYYTHINGPISAGDCALLINCIIFNNIMKFRDYSVETYGTAYDDIFNITNGILSIFMLDLVHMINILYLEANQIYSPAGEITRGQEQSVQPALLEGEERAKALIEMGRPDLIETDVKIRRI